MEWKQKSFLDLAGNDLFVFILKRHGNVQMLRRNDGNTCLVGGFSGCRDWFFGRIDITFFSEESSLTGDVGGIDH